jgi:hypothetical protein
MPLTEEIPIGTFCLFQVVPPFVVPMTTPKPVPLLPTASQVVDDLQAMPLRSRATTGYDRLTLQVGDLAPETAGDANPVRRTRTDAERRAHASRPVRDLDNFTSETPPIIPPPRYPGSKGLRRHF